MRQKHAALMIRTDVFARWKAFEAGLRKLGYHIRPPDFTPEPEDVLVIWNRHRHAAEARKFEASGATVLIAENGWVRRGDGLKTIALCVGHHNGAGLWYEGPEDRWSQLGIDLKPWRETGEHILVLVQRGIGEPGVAQPRDWLSSTLGQLQAKTRRKVIVRRHPGNAEPPPEPDWRDCWAAVTWASGAGIKSVISGVPIFYGLRSWIGAPAGNFGIDDIENPFLGDRLPMLRRLTHAQWFLEELATGEPFARLLRL